MFNSINNTMSRCLCSNTIFFLEIVYFLCLYLLRELLDVVLCPPKSTLQLTALFAWFMAETSTCDCVNSNMY